MLPSPPTSENIERAAQILREGGLVAMPTETVYGLAGDASSPAAVARIFALKRRPTSHPLIVHLGAAGWLDRWAREWTWTAVKLGEQGCYVAAGKTSEVVPAVPIVNPATLSDLEELGSSPAFMDKLINVFVTDNVTLMSRIESALGARNVAEFRSHLHAMKGSAASMGAERLTGYCKDLGHLSDAEVKLQIPALLTRLRDELAATRDSLERYLQDRKKSTG